MMNSSIISSFNCSLDGIDLSPGDLTVISGDTHIYILYGAS